MVSWDKWTLTVPDDNLYVVLAVTADIAMSGTFNDYGGPGSTPYSGTYELPLWNSWFNGPDLTSPSHVRIAPYSYFWDPSATVFYTSGDDEFISGDAGVIDVSQAMQGFSSAPIFNVYYAQLRNLGVPLARLRLTWEDELGNGPEYSGFSSQQIIYPEYAGCGSPDIDMGSSAMVPNINPEIAGGYGINAPDGDADFADIIEDIFKSGTLALLTQLGTIQRGLNCCELPGMVQQNGIVVLEPSSPRLPFYRPNNANAVLLAIGLARQVGSGTPSIADGAGNTWTPITSGDQYAVWYCAAARAATGNVVTLSPSGGNQFNASLFIGEMDPDSDVVGTPAVATGTGTEASVAITVSGPCWILGIAITPAVFNLLTNTPPLHWDWAFGNYGGGLSVFGGFGGADDRVRIAKRYVAAAGTYTFSLPVNASAAWVAVALAISASQPVSYPKPLGKILDDTTMQLCRLQARANGLYGSLYMDSQKDASAWLKDLYQAMNAWPVWSGFRLKSIPMSEVSAVGSGVVYTAPTAAGPIADLNPGADGDFIGDGNNSVITVKRAAQVDTFNVLQMQFPDRDSFYAPVTISEPEPSGVSQYGPRKQSAQVLTCVPTATIARMLLGIAIRRKALIRNTYGFKLKAQWGLLEAGDLVTISEPRLNISKPP